MHSQAGALSGQYHAHQMHYQATIKNDTGTSTSRSGNYQNFVAKSQNYVA